MSFITMTLVVLFGVNSAEVKPTSGGGTDVSQSAVKAEKLPQHWATSYEKARKQAARAKLPLLLHFEATWCGACRRMDGEVLERADVRNVLGREVIGVRVDADMNKGLISEFGITTLPTEVVVFSDGSMGGRYVGSTSLSSYLSRLKDISRANRAVVLRSGKASRGDEIQLASRQEELSDSSAKEKPEDEKSVRSCLIVRHDGKMVGVGGFSPVALTEGRRWKKGTPLFRVSHEGVCYFLQSKEELVRFEDNPEKYIPHLHGCDLVELYNENRATAGAIEYGAFYKGQVYFFASLENRARFEDNPSWYTGVMSDSRTANGEMFPFLNQSAMNN